MLAEAAPDQIREQRMKIKMLSKELAGLVQQRKEMERMRGNRKTKQRANRRKQDMAVRIQSVFRGFLVRLHMKRLRMSAKKIQRCWREFGGRKPKESEPELAKEDDERRINEEETVVTEEEAGKEEEDVAERLEDDAKSQAEEVAKRFQEEETRAEVIPIETEAQVEDTVVEQEEAQMEEAIMTLDRM